MSLEKLVELSRRYGADLAYTVAESGNTSFKDKEFLYIKPTGMELANITEADFVRLDCSILREWQDWGENAENEARSCRLMRYAAVDGGVPSIEAPLHAMLPYRYVAHLHPALVNGMVCGKDGEAIAQKLFPGAPYVAYRAPGVTLAQCMRRAIAACPEAPKVVFLKNHGVVVAADDPSEIDAMYSDMLAKLEAHCAGLGVPTALVKAAEPDAATVAEYAPLLRSWLGDAECSRVVCATGAFHVASGALTPEHNGATGAFGLLAETPSPEAIASFAERFGGKPAIVSIPGKVVFCAGSNRAEAENIRRRAENYALTEQIAAAFGGVRLLTDAELALVKQGTSCACRRLPLAGKVAVVTGGAQGFGYGIARELAGFGADIVIADMNVAGAAKAAAEIGPGALGVAVNIADEASVEAMFTEVVRAFGGVDLFVANAGVLKAGSVKDFNLKDWEFVTDVNYNGYFLCAKHCARLMSRQNKASGRWTDIVQVNSKSGLVGSKNNGAYAGSKFGSIGLTQSFALELIADKIKVNSVCPGNFFDGPLWSDPVKGLFVQYLNTGKVPGAKTVEDVKAYYENLIPMRRGCFPEDVARAIAYSVLQQYETGQAIPVTGGQVMLS